MATARRGRGRPRKSEGETAQAIMDSAVRVFADKGFDAANLREIATYADVNMALISYQFGSKSDLWQKIIADVGAQMEAALSLTDGETAYRAPEAALRDAMMSFIAFASAHPVIARFLLRDVSHAPGRAQWVYDKVTRPLLDHFMPLMESAKGAQRLHTHYPEMAFLHFAYGVAISIVRRQLFIRLLPQVADEETFRTALQETLIEPMFRHG